MSELKPLGSEKLQGDDKLKRILELTYYNNNKKINESKAELVKESKNGGVYGIVKEKDGYYVKKGLNEGSLDYIGGMYMKNKNKFSSYAEAYKRLEFIKGQEELHEEVKYKLNLPQAAPAQSEAPAPEPSMDAAPPAPTPDMGGEQSPAPEMGDDSKPEGETPATPDMGGESNPEGGDSTDGDDNQTGKRSDYMAEVQKYAGKLGQELRDLHDTMESDDIKYVLNMVISAVDLDKLSDDDIEEIGKKFERDESMGNTDDENTDDEDMGSDEQAPDENLGEEEDPMVKLDEFINTPMNTDEIDLSHYADLDEKKKPEPVRPPLGAHGETHMDEEESFDLDEIKNEIHRTIGKTLSKYFK